MSTQHSDHSLAVAEGVDFLRDACEVMASLIDTHRPPGFAPVEPAKYFDVLVCSIIGQQLSVRAADTIEGRVRELAGKLTPGAFTGHSDEDMRAVGLSFQKISYIRGIEDAFVSGQITPDFLATADDHSIQQSLTALKGVGPWTAEMFMIFGLGRLDVWSPGDLGLRRAVEYYFGELTPTTADRWTPYRSIAAWYLWEHSDTLAGRVVN